MMLGRDRALIESIGILAYQISILHITLAGDEGNLKRFGSSAAAPPAPWPAPPVSIPLSAAAETLASCPNTFATSDRTRSTVARRPDRRKAASSRLPLCLTRSWCLCSISAWNRSDPTLRVAWLKSSSSSSSRSAKLASTYCRYRSRCCLPRPPTGSRIGPSVRNPGLPASPIELR